MNREEERSASSRDALRHWSRAPILLLLLGLVVIVMLVTFDRIRKRQHQEALLLSAIMDVQIDLSNFHLWFEEYVIGDANVDLDEAWGTLAHAVALNDSMVKGGYTEHGRILSPLKDAKIIRMVEHIQSRISAMKGLGVQRLRNLEESGVGTGPDERFDDVFIDIMLESKALESHLIARAARHLSWSQRIFSAILSAWLVLLVCSIVIFVRVERRRKCAVDRIDAALKEKEVMLGELHHRVKNNLQTISSLVKLQARGVKEQTVLNALRDCHQRIMSIARVHERLYSARNFTYIDFGFYLKTLVNDLFRSCKQDRVRVNPVVDVDDLRLAIDQAIPCGLIINELVTNALKYAFAGGFSGDTGEVRISMNCGQGGDVEMSVADNGVGLPEGLDYRKTETLGLQLVCLLIGQLKGDIELDRTKGTAFRIRFRNVLTADGAA